MKKSNVRYVVEHGHVTIRSHVGEIYLNEKNVTAALVLLRSGNEAERFAPCEIMGGGKVNVYTEDVKAVTKKYLLWGSY